MKVSIGYDGSSIGDAALDNLQRAGLPENVEAVILNTAGGWLSTKSDDEAKRLAHNAFEHLKKNFPTWDITALIGSGALAAEILEKAETFKPDLIVVGEPRQLLRDHNIFLAGVSDKVLTEAKTSVRISRGRIGEKTNPVKIVIGFDGSGWAMTTVEAVASRYWPAGSEVRLVLVTDADVISSVGRFVPQMSNSVIEAKVVRQWAETLTEAPLRMLKDAGLITSLNLESGHPRDVLIELAEKWDADTIFVGPHCAGNSFERFLLGSVSASVAARAHCSVEVIRHF